MKQENDMTATLVRMPLILPRLVLTHDYHDFPTMEDAYKQIGLTLKVKEVGFDGSRGKYVGIVYSGRRPSKSIVADLLKQKKIVTDEIWA
jgi:hypothetical protein